MNDIELYERKSKAFDKYGQFEYTLHENMFASLFPYLERQVTFGTGKGGYKKWGAKKFTADFYDPDNNIVYEIDGSSHKRLINQITDELKKRFLREKGIMTVRIKNEQVEKLFNKETKKWGEAFEQFTNGFF